MLPPTIWWSPITAVWSSPRHARPNVLDKRQQKCSLWVPLDVWAPIKDQSLVRKWKSIGRKVDREEDGKTKNTNFCSLVRILEEICLKQFDWKSFFFNSWVSSGTTKFPEQQVFAFLPETFSKETMFLISPGKLWGNFLPDHHIRWCYLAHIFLITCTYWYLINYQYLLKSSWLPICTDIFLITCTSWNLLDYLYLQISS